MTEASTPSDRLARPLGYALVGAAGLTPLLAWIAPLGFAPLLALMGLISLPAVRLKDEDRPAIIVLFAALIWAAASTTWSPYVPKNAGTSTILKLTLQLPLYFSAICGARRAAPDLQRLALRVLAYGTAAFSVLMLVEAGSGGVVYRTLHQAYYEPIRIDLAQANLGHSTYAYALLWPLAVMGAPRKLRLAIGLLIGAMLFGAGLVFGADAPVLAVFLVPIAALAIWKWPGAGPKVFAGVTAAIFLLTPTLVWAIRAGGYYDKIEARVPLSWSERMGYWGHALDWIGDHPFKGWGLDASRMFAPGIQLHPHDGALQVWLELGAVGAVGAAAFWAVTLLRLVSPKRSAAMGAAAGAAAAYMLFGAVNFGIWQEWWLALGALSIAFTACLVAEEVRARQAST